MKHYKDKECERQQQVRNKMTERLKADNYLHVPIIPSVNDELLLKNYKVKQKGIESSWHEMIADQSKYVIIDPKTLMTPTITKYPELREYLSIRYWAHK